MRLLAAIITLTALVLGCTEKNLLLSEIGTITGRVSPATAHAIVYLDDHSDSAWVEDDGFFIFPDVALGEHMLSVDAAGFTRRTIRHVIVLQAKTTNVGLVQISTFPYPIFSCNPQDGEANVALTEGMYFRSDERMDLSSLQAHAILTPELAGAWREYEDYGPPYVYFFDTNSPDGHRLPFEVGVQYQLHLPTEVRMFTGEPLAYPLVTKFSTVPLTAVLNVANDSRVRIPLDGVYLNFNAPVQLDSLNKAFTIEPALDARWFGYLSEPTTETARLIVPVGVWPKPDTWYALSISDRVVLSDSLKLPKTYVALFRTQGFNVSSIAPGLNRAIWGSDSVEVRLNFPGDTTSIMSALRVSPHGGEPIPLQILWSEDRATMKIATPGGWVRGTTYDLTISRSASSIDGLPMQSDFVSYFYAY